MRKKIIGGFIFLGIGLIGLGCQTKNPDDLLMSGMQKAIQNDYEGAIADYTKAIELAPNNSSLYITRAGAYDLNGNPSAALSDYEKAIELEPSLAPALQAQIDYLGGKSE